MEATGLLHGYPAPTCVHLKSYKLSKLITTIPFWYVLIILQIEIQNISWITSYVCSLKITMV